MADKEMKIEYPKLIAGCIVLAFMAVFSFFTKEALVGSSLRGYAETPCEIVDSKVERQDVSHFTLTAEFAYECGGRRKSAWLDRPGNGKFAFKRLEHRLPLMEKYAPGTKHVCLVNADSPNDAVLRIAPVYLSPDDAMNGEIAKCGPLVFLAIFGIFGVGMIVSSLPVVKKRLTKKARGVSLAMFMMLFSVPFFGVGTLVSISIWSDFKLEKTFVRVPAKVLYSGVSVHSKKGKNSTSLSYEPRIGYRYEVGGKKYESDRYTLMRAVSGDCSDAQAVADAYKPGDRVDAYVSGENPRISVLKSFGDVPPPLAMIVMPACFALVGYGLFVGALFYLLLNMLKRGEAAAAAAPRVLKRTKRDSIFLLLFVLVWNVMAWSIALSVIRRPFILPHLLVAIHPLVGLGIAFYAVRKIIREIAAPKLELTMSLQSPSFAQLEWRIDEPDALASFEISLEASKLVHGGRSPRMLMEKSIPLCRQDAPSIPSAWRLGFDLPGGGADDLMTWLIVVRMKTHSCKRPYVVKYSLGGQF